MNDKYEKWRSEWEAAKVDREADLVALWKKPVPSDWKRDGWKLIQGFRSSSAELRGEQTIESLLLGAKGGINIHWIKRGNQKWPFVAMHHRLPLANQSKSQVIADAFGLILLGSEVHPVVVEVKVSANDCWSAMVQNLLQIRMLRCCHEMLKTEHAIDFRGVWGIVLAPEAYLKKDQATFAACKKVMASLKFTEARVAFCSCDGLEKRTIKYLAGNWR